MIGDGTEAGPMTGDAADELHVAIREQVNTMAFTSAMLAIAGFCGWFMFYIGLPFAIGAVVCGAIALRRSDRMGGAGRRTAIVGMVTGAVMSIAGIIGIVILVSGGSSG